MQISIKFITLRIFTNFENEFYKLEKNRDFWKILKFVKCAFMIIVVCKWGVIDWEHVKHINDIGLVMYTLLP